MQFGTLYSRPSRVLVHSQSHSLKPPIREITREHTLTEHRSIAIVGFSNRSFQNTKVMLFIQSFQNLCMWGRARASLRPARDYSPLNGRLAEGRSLLRLRLTPSELIQITNCNCFLINHFTAKVSVNMITFTSTQTIALSHSCDNL